MLRPILQGFVLFAVMLSAGLRISSEHEEFKNDISPGVEVVVDDRQGDREPAGARILCAQLSTSSVDQSIASNGCDWKCADITDSRMLRTAKAFGTCAESDANGLPTGFSSKRRDAYRMLTVKLKRSAGAQAGAQSQVQSQVQSVVGTAAAKSNRSQSNAPTGGFHADDDNGGSSGRLPSVQTSQKSKGGDGDDNSGFVASSSSMSYCIEVPAAQRDSAIANGQCEWRCAAIQDEVLLNKAKADKSCAESIGGGKYSITGKRRSSFAKLFDGLRDGTIGSMPVYTGGGSSGARGTNRGVMSGAAGFAGGASTGPHENRNEVSIGPLACVSQGLHNARPDIRGQSVDKWISLLGDVATRYYGLKPENGAPYIQRVMEMISSYGYCTDDEFRILPSQHVIAGPQNGERDRFGRTIKQMNVGHEVNTNDLDEVFGSGPSNQFSYETSSLHERQWHFRSLAKGYSNRFTQSAFTNCVTKIMGRYDSDPALNFRSCKIRVHQSSNQEALRIVTTTGSESEIQIDAKENQALYNSMADACGVPRPRPYPNDNRCASQCFSSGIYGRSGGYLCPRDRSRDDNRNEREHHRDRPTSGGRDEPSRDRGNYNGGGNGQDRERENRDNSGRPDHASPDSSRGVD